MKIALAHKRLDRRGGTEAILYRTAEGLRDLGHEVHLFCGKISIAPPGGVFAHKVPYWPLGRTARLLSFAYLAPKVIGPYRCDVVVSFGRMVSQDVLRSGGGSHKVFLERMGPAAGGLKKMWYRLSPYHRSVLALERRQFGNGGFKKVIAISERVKGEIVGTYGVRPEKVQVIYNGVDLERFHPRNRETWRADVRGRLGVSADRAVVLFVGNGFHRKGLDLLLDAWTLPGLRDFILLVVGTDRSMARYVERVRAAGLADRVLFAGADLQVEKYYAAADLFAMPSFQEAFGNASLEALASGRPIVVPRVAGASEILEGELADGIIEKPEDRADLEYRVVRLLDRDRRPRLSAAARQLAEKYSWQRYFQEFEKHLGEVARPRP